ncbi:hypothetical protein B7463_g3589, partial [Scytalidium lignicola]
MAHDSPDSGFDKLDEGGQINVVEFASLSAYLDFDRVIIVGDDHQLAPVVNHILFRGFTAELKQSMITLTTTPVGKDSCVSSGCHEQPSCEAQNEDVFGDTLNNNLVAFRSGSKTVYRQYLLMKTIWKVTRLEQFDPAKFGLQRHVVRAGRRLSKYNSWEIYLKSFETPGTFKEGAFNYRKYTITQQIYGVPANDVAQLQLIYDQIRDLIYKFNEP